MNSYWIRSIVFSTKLLSLRSKFVTTRAITVENFADVKLARSSFISISSLKVRQLCILGDDNSSLCVTVTLKMIVTLLYPCHASCLKSDGWFLSVTVTLSLCVVWLSSLTWLEHVTQETLNRYTPDCLAEKQFFDGLGTDHAHWRQHEKQFSEAHLLTMILPADIVSQHNLGLILVTFHLSRVPQTTQVWNRQIEDFLRTTFCIHT